ncbi:MAG: Cytosine-specific methyltransferase [Verrucomicrobiales bacterium]|nr:Cytosine-specific methyltransferase [Verrucomicrobiales bacterium]
MNTRTAIDLFSGCGGLTQGLKSAGFKVVAAAEIRPEARETYLLNHPQTKMYEDIRRMTVEGVLANVNLDVGELDLIAACPPCQGFSSIRTKNRCPVDDPRNELIFDVMRLIKGIRPKCILIENVPKLLTDVRLIHFKMELSNFGYHFTEGILDAQNFGVPQRRKRMILIGSRFESIELPNVVGTKCVLKDAIWGLPTPEGRHKLPLHRIRQHLSKQVQERVNAITENRCDLPDHLKLPCHQRYPEGFKDVYGRLSWEKVSSTITRSSHNPSKGRFLHPEQNRGLTMYEAMLIQGFPKRYKFPKHFGIGKISSMIGEAFPPPMAAAQGSHLLNKLEELDAKTRKK